MIHRQYLPYAVASNYGSSVANALTGQQTYYRDRYGADGNYAYTLTEREMSPSDRPLRTHQAGVAFQSAQCSMSCTYAGNSATDVLRMDVDMTTCGLTVNGYYASNTLCGTAVTNEDGGVTVTYSDFDGRTVMTDSRSTDTSGTVTH